MPKWVLSLLLGFIGLTVALTLISAVIPGVGGALSQYFAWCNNTAASCIRNRQPGDQPGLCVTVAPVWWVARGVVRKVRTYRLNRAEGVS
jgi:hypothetical protein